MADRVAVIGGGIAGLSAAQAAENHGHEVRLYDSGGYHPGDDRRNGWGEVVENYSAIPRGRDVDGFLREVEGTREIQKEEEKYLEMEDGVVIDRDRFEKSWANSLDAEIRTHQRVDAGELKEIATEFDLVIDASGLYPVSREYTDIEYVKTVPTISCNIEGDFSDFHPEPHAMEHRKYFMWVVTHSDHRATIGLGTGIRDQPGKMLEDLQEKCAQIGIPAPEREQVTVSLDSAGAISNLENASYELDGTPVMLVGDAIGITNQVTGFGMSRSAETATMAIECFEQGRDYSKELGDRFRKTKTINSVFSGLESLIGVSGIAHLLSPGTPYRVLEERSFSRTVRDLKEVATE